MAINKVLTTYIDKNYLDKKNIQPFYETVIRPVNHSKFNEAVLFEIVDRVTISSEAKKMYLKTRTRSMLPAKIAAKNYIKRIPITSKQSLLEYKAFPPVN